MALGSGLQDEVQTNATGLQDEAQTNAMDVDPPPRRRRQPVTPRATRAESGPVAPSLLSSSINIASLSPKDSPRRTRSAANVCRSASPPRDGSGVVRPPSSPLKRLGEYRSRTAWGPSKSSRDVRASPTKDRRIEEEVSPGGTSPRRSRSHQEASTSRPGDSTSPGPWNRLTSLFGHSSASSAASTSAFAPLPSSGIAPPTTPLFRPSLETLPPLGGEEGEIVMLSPSSSPIPPATAASPAFAGPVKGKGTIGRSNSALADSDDEDPVAPIGEDLKFSMEQDEACFVDSFPSPHTSRSPSPSASPFASLGGSMLASTTSTQPRKIDFISTLPIELALTTLLMIEDHSTLLKCMLVSRRWNFLAGDSLVWRGLFESHAREGWRVRNDALVSAADRKPLSRRPSSRSVPSTPGAEHGMRKILSEMLGELGGLTIAPLGGGGGNEAVDTTQTARRPQLGQRAASSGQKSALGLTPISSKRPSYGGESEIVPGGGLDWWKLYRDRWLLQERWRNGEMEKQFLRGHEDGVYCLQFDEVKIVTGSRDKSVKIWDSPTGALLQTLYGHSGSVLCLRYDGNTLLTGSSDCCVFVWSLSPPSSPASNLSPNPSTSPSRVLRKLVGHSSGVLDVNFDSRHVVSCSKDTSIRIWDRTQNYIHVRTLRGHNGPVNAIQLKDDLLLSASGDSFMKLWDVVTGQVVRIFQGHKRGLACVRWVGDLVVSGSNDQTIKVWEVETGKCLRTLEGHEDLVRAVAVDPASNRLVSGSYDNTVKIWDFATGDMLLDCRHSQTGLVFDVQLDCSRVMAVGHHPAVMILNFGKGLDCSKFV